MANPSDPVETGDLTSVPPGVSLTAELQKVEEANLALYEALRAKDIEAMARLWSHSPHTRCVHPGWELVVGWAEIRSSWVEIFRTIDEIEIELENPHIEVAPQNAWVNLVAHLSVTTDEGELFRASVVVTNIFEKLEGRWQVVLHHSSNFLEETEPEDDEDDEDLGPTGVPSDSNDFN